MTSLSGLVDIGRRRKMGRTACLDEWKPRNYRGSSGEPFDVLYTNSRNRIHRATVTGSLWPDGKYSLWLDLFSSGRARRRARPDPEHAGGGRRCRPYRTHSRNLPAAARYAGRDYGTHDAISFPAIRASTHSGRSAG